MKESELQRRVCRVTDQLRPLSHRRLFLDRPGDLNCCSGAARTDTNHQAAAERWRMMSMVEP
jgi:hypothetical protein